jgi:histidyl-tRNA synthetase
MTLRPELTAGVVRALLEHKLLAQGPQRLYYVGPFFRYERPQAGRYRQANQFGVECFGVAGAEADAEVIQIAALLLARYGIGDAVLNVNSVGDAACRPVYRQALLDHFRPHAAELSADSQRRLEQPAAHPRLEGRQGPALRRDGTRHGRPAVRRLPRALRGAAAVSRRARDRARRQPAHRSRPGLLHAHVFEFVSTAIGAQGTICGGGRYDGLVAELGGPPTPGVGLGLGIERFLRRGPFP